MGLLSEEAGLERRDYGFLTRKYQTGIMGEKLQKLINLSLINCVA